MRSYVLVFSAMLLVLGIAGCSSVNNSSAMMQQREDLLLLREDVTQLYGRVEGVEIEYQRLQNEINSIQTAVSQTKNQNAAVKQRLDKLEGRTQKLNAERIKDQQKIVDKLSIKIADMFNESGRQGARNTEGYEHIVQEGETLSAIAAAYKVKASVIVEANNLKNADFVKKGQKLFIPK